jgi:hypothetical protein
VRVWLVDGYQRVTELRFGRQTCSTEALVLHSKTFSLVVQDLQAQKVHHMQHKMPNGNLEGLCMITEILTLFAQYKYNMFTQPCVAGQPGIICQLARIYAANKTC